MKKDIYQVVRNVIKALELRDSSLAEEWSNRLVHSTSIYQHEACILVSVIAYAIAKILGNEKLREKYPEEWKDFIEAMRKNLNAALERIDDEKEFVEALKVISQQIKEFDENFSQYAEHIMRFASVQKGKRIYAHGLSLTKVAEMLGISKWELMEKVAEMKSEEPHYVTLKERMRYARRLLE